MQESGGIIHLIGKFFDNDHIHLYGRESKKPVVIGIRVNRDFYRCKDATLIYADWNAALNNLRKGSITEFTVCKNIQPQYIKLI